MEYNLLSEINPSRHNWRIKVRVARMWKLSRTSKGTAFAAIELILVDEEVHGLTYAFGLFCVLYRFSVTLYFPTLEHRHYSFHWTERPEQIY